MPWGPHVWPDIPAPHLLPHRAHLSPRERCVPAFILGDGVEPLALNRERLSPRLLGPQMPL